MAPPIFCSPLRSWRRAAGFISCTSRVWLWSTAGNPTLALAAKPTPYPSDAEVAAQLQAHAAHVSMVPSGELATALGNVRVANVILLGSLSSIWTFRSKCR